MLGAANASELPDYSDRDTYTCDKDNIEAHMTDLLDGNPANIKLLYVKGTPVETARKANELRCRVTLVTSVATVSGVFRYVNQDDHALFAFQPNRSK